MNSPRSWVLPVFVAAMSLHGPVARAQAASGLSAGRAEPGLPRSFGAPGTGFMRFGAQLDGATSVGTLGGAGTVQVTIGALIQLRVDLGDAVFEAIMPALRMESGRVEAGDLILQGAGNVDVGREHRLLIGGGIALPTATDTPIDCMSYYYCGRASWMRQLAWSFTMRNAPGWADGTVTLWPSIDYTLGVPWFLLHAVATVPVFFPIDPVVGGPQPLARGNVELMVTLELETALRIEHQVDLGVGLLAWALPSGAGATTVPDPYRYTRPLPVAQAAVTFFVRTDPELDSPIGGGAEFLYDLDDWYNSFQEDIGQAWGLRLFLSGHFDVAS